MSENKLQTKRDDAIFIVAEVLARKREKMGQKKEKEEERRVDNKRRMSGRLQSILNEMIATSM